MTFFSLFVQFERGNQFNSISDRTNLFYLIRGPLKYKFGYQKCIYIAGLEIEISRKLYLMYGHGGHLEKLHFVHCWDTF